MIPPSACCICQPEENRKLAMPLLLAIMCSPHVHYLCSFLVKNKTSKEDNQQYEQNATETDTIMLQI